MRVVVDAFGGDNAPLEIIKGASLASNEYSAEITLTGKEETIKKIIFTILIFILGIITSLLVILS